MEYNTTKLTLLSSIIIFISMEFCFLQQWFLSTRVDIEVWETIIQVLNGTFLNVYIYQYRKSTNDFIRKYIKKINTI